MKLFRSLAVLATAPGLASAIPAQAHPALVSSSPAASTAASNVRTVTLTFNEAFMSELSGLEIVMTGMPGMAGQHPAMKINGVKVTVGADRKTLVATLARPLPVGTYDVNWHAVGDDTHRVSGKVSFTVR
jgi:methionine-rich copper-binding protein CopC